MAKGSAYERDFCKRLSRWWTDGKRDDVFYRTSNSGGRASTRAKKGETTFGQYGDVCASDPIGLPLIKATTIELKRGYNNSTIHNLLDKTERHKEQQFEKWYKQITTDAERAGSIGWLLVTRRDRREEVVWMQDTFWDSFCSELHRCPFLRLEMRWGPEKKYEEICGMLLRDWFQIVKPRVIEYLVERKRH